MIAPDRVVAMARSARADYDDLPQPVAAPELDQEIVSVAGLAVRELFRHWGLDADHFDSPQWNPLGELVPAGARVVIKPNWVNHYNKAGAGIECLLTHTSVIEAILRYVALTRPASVIVGDAPIQSCDFDRLRDVAGLDVMAERLRRSGLDISILDFRRTLLPADRVGGPQFEDVRPQADYVLVDLGSDSLLEPLGRDASKFRVTMYDPDRMLRAHREGRHQYLIARQILDADVVINVPKLKTHKKAGITGALKNLVGINGNKEFLPHHRKGGSLTGGDCYAGGSRLKLVAETLLDSANRHAGTAVATLEARLADVAVRGARMLGSDSNIEGAWFGNDTVWRTCLDLQRVLRYCRADGSLAPAPQRQVISITDAIVAGEKNGPLAPTPIGAGFITGALNPAAAEWVHSRLMGFDPKKIPVVRHAFDPFLYPIADFSPSSIVVQGPDGPRSASEMHAVVPHGFDAPEGWKGYIELPAHDR